MKPRGQSQNEDLQLYSMQHVPKLQPNFTETPEFQQGPEGLASNGQKL